MTAAERVRAYLDTRTRAFPWAPLTIDYAVDNTHEEHTLTATDLRELVDIRTNLTARIQLEIDAQPADVPTDGHFYYEAVVVGLTDALNIVKELTA